MMDRVLKPVGDWRIPNKRRLTLPRTFSQENQGFVDRFEEYFPGFSSGRVLDAGCGPADIPIRFARRYPSCHLTAVDLLH